ncbi:TPA: hypothetical protein ACJMEG_002077, partial [Neisseria meningitidis]
RPHQKAQPNQCCPRIKNKIGGSLQPHQMPSEHAFGRRFYNKNTSWRLVLCLSKFLCRAYLKISDGIGLCCLKSVFRFSL